jgi:hypothetical protein
MKQTIKLTEAQWLAVYNDIARSYPPSVLLIRDRMRSVLGFTSRTHREWHDQTGYVQSIHLDFYSEKKMSWFRLKYSEQLNGS